MKRLLFLLIMQTIVVHAEKLENTCHEIHLNTCHEIPLDLLKEILPHNPVILEAGAHCAQDTRWMAEVWPQGTIHAFEPTPVNFNCVCSVAQQYSNIKCYAYALDYECGVKLFYQDGDEDRGTQGANSLLPHKLLQKSSNSPIKVECLTIDV